MHFLYPWTHNPDHVLWSFSRQDAYHLLDYPIPLGRPWIPLFSHYNLPLTRLFGLGLLDLTWPGPCGPEFLLPFACRLFTFHMTKSTDIVVGNFLVTFCFFCSRSFRILNNKYSARSTFSSRVCRLSLHVAYLKNKKKKRPGGRKQKASRFTYLELGSRTCETLAEIRLGIEGVPGVGHRSQSQSHMWALTRGYRLAAEGFLFVSFFPVLSFAACRRKRTSSREAVAAEQPETCSLPPCHVALEWMPKSWGLQLVILWHLRGLSIMESKGCKQADAFSWQPGGFYLFIA